MSLTVANITATVFTVAIAFAGSATAQSNSSTESPQDIVATQIRSQGYPCDEPSSAVLNKDSSSPDGNDWILTCNNAVYNVKLVPSMAAQVEKIE
jgi:hypothetical protein